MPLQLPICNFDAKTGLLCPICEEKVRNGKIGEADVEVSKALVTLAGRLRGLESVTLVKSFKVDREYLLEVGEPGLPALREESALSELGRILGGRVWTAGASSSNRQLVEDLVRPLTVSRLSTLWLPDGSRLAKVVLERGTSKMMSRLDTVRRLVSMARGIDLVFEFEYQASGEAWHVYVPEAPATALAAGEAEPATPEEGQASTGVYAS